MTWLKAPYLTGTGDLHSHLLLREVVFHQTAHDLLGRPGCAQVRGDHAAQNPFCIADPTCAHTHTHRKKTKYNQKQKKKKIQKHVSLNPNLNWKSLTAFKEAKQSQQYRRYRQMRVCWKVRFFWAKFNSIKPLGVISEGVVRETLPILLHQHLVGLKHNLSFSAHNIWRLEHFSKKRGRFLFP